MAKLLLLAILFSPNEQKIPASIGMKVGKLPKEPKKEETEWYWEPYADCFIERVKK